jgi:outer membrane protein assembly factor BamB
MQTPSERQQDAIAAGPPTVSPERAQESIAAGSPPLAPSKSPRRTNWLVVSAMVLLLAAFAGLALFQTLLKNRTYTNAERLAKLAKAELPRLAPAPTTDWPQWRGPNRDGVSGEKNLLLDWPNDGLRVVWEKRAGKGYAAPVIAAGRVYLHMQDKQDEAVVCFDADSGKELWRARYPAQYKNSYGDGPRSTPTIDGEYIYTVGGTGILHCLKTHPASRDGEVVWRADLLTDFDADNLKWGVSFSTLVVGDVLYTMPGGRGTNSLVAFDKKSGSVRWRTGADPAGYASPVFATLANTPQIIFFTANGLVGVDPAKGDLLWSFPWQTDYGTNIATPIIAGNYVFISTGYNRGCALIEIQKAQGKLEAHSVYENHALHNHFSSSVLYQDHVYGFDEAELRCVNFRTGEIAWKHRDRELGKGALLVADGHLIVLGEYGKLALVEATPAGYKEKTWCTVSDRKCWVVPALSAGRLYIRDQEKLMCLDVRKQ